MKAKVACFFTNIFSYYLNSLEIAHNYVLMFYVKVLELSINRILSRSGINL